MAGVDEVGRGPLAGPVVAGAVVLPFTRARWVARLRDSKLLTAGARAELAAEARDRCDCAVGVVSPQVVDQIGIGPATRLAMRRAVLALEHPPDALIVDGRQRVEWRIPQRELVRADAQWQIGGGRQHRRQGSARRHDGAAGGALSGLRLRAP